MKRRPAKHPPFTFAERLRAFGRGIRRGLIVSVAVVAMVTVYVVASMGALLSTAGLSTAMMLASSQPANAHRRRRRYRRRYRSRRRWRRRGRYRRRYRRRRYYSRRRRRRGWYGGPCVGAGPVWFCP